MSVSQRNATVRQPFDVDRYSISGNFVHFSEDQISLLVDHVCRNRQDLSRRRIILQHLNSGELSKPVQGKRPAVVMPYCSKRAEVERPAERRGSRD